MRVGSGCVLVLFFGLGVFLGLPTFQEGLCEGWGRGEVAEVPAWPSSRWGPGNVHPQVSCLIVGPFLIFSEEMPYLRCPLHTVLKLTPVAYGECGDAGRTA